MISGIINVYKEKGYTSHDVVAKLRGLLRQKKIGHTGTLDPDAEGVLPVCLGKATRACDMLTEKDKEYEAVMLFGKTTDTQDITGTVMSQQAVDCSEEEIRNIIMSFKGSYAQIPPMYSALKVNGKKLCDLARAGVTVERSPRTVQIYDIRILETALPRVRISVHCSKGTYIRTLCHDIGEMAGCGGCMETLVRTRVSGFRLCESHRISEIEEQICALRQQQPGRELTKSDLKNLIIDTDSVFLEYPYVCVREEFSKLLYNGNPLSREWIKNWDNSYKTQTLRVYDSRQTFVGMYQWKESSRDIRPLKIFME
ncbi:tRNA pseudouridine(55) synthase TruB [Lachnospiraceae bacterium]|nr:tRNA pseudouridine(55) synthase TruB [Lachnospiraceae bacterium]